MKIKMLLLLNYFRGKTRNCNINTINHLQITTKICGVFRFFINIFTAQRTFRFLPTITKIKHLADCILFKIN